MNKKTTNKDSSTTYNTPAELLASDDISRDEKIRLLKDWEYTLRQIQVVEEESIKNGPDVDLKNVLDALRELGAESIDTGISKT